MADLLNLHLLQAKQWRDLEKSNLILQWDRRISDAAKEFCPSDSNCTSLIKFLTETVSLQILFALVLAIFIWKASEHLKLKNQIIVLSSYAALFGLGDFFSNQLKYIFQRMRPDHAIFFLDNASQGSFNPSFSFPSNHAFNLFALSTLTYLFYRKKYIKGVNFPMALFIIALIVGISRVLVWRHYPLDILGGLFFGSLLALIFQRIVCKFVHAPVRADKLK